MAYGVSSRWEKFIRRGFTPITEIDVRFPGQGVVLSGLRVTSGSVSVSRGDSERTSGSLEVADPTLFPTLNNASIIEPYGAEIVIHTGILYPEGNTELIPVGVFPIENVSGSEAGGNLASIKFYDRAKRMQDIDFIAPVNQGGKLILDVIEEQVLYSAPFYPGDGVEWTVGFSEELDNFILPWGTLLESDRWDFIEELAESLGAEAYFDREGGVRVEPIPGIYGDGEVPEPDWIIDAGENGILIDASRSVSRTGVHNGVVVTGSADGDRAQPYALVTDDNPNSRTMWGGPFGKSVIRIDNSNLTTVEQCEKQARAELRNRTGLQRSLSFKAVGNPAMDPGDIILIRFLDGSEELHMLDGYDYDFASADLSAQTRSIQYIAPEDE
jgi:hypothetical protein